ncbi:hypothetical protein D1AOALGA4SA_3555 [Olavius algarvensis Delta 1 endosymbiont]|nr:hypothetical protein D1AOALGA4SA_3555 [Olavius algarvensis Delta 1 endosymbiont]
MPAKALISGIILTMALAMAGAMGQIIVHDIIPTFFSSSPMEHRGGKAMQQMEQAAEDTAEDSRGDLFGEDLTEKESEKPSLIHSEQFVWLLKWTHIHLFGINMIFIFMGAITLFLDLRLRTRTWLVALPFVGVFIDIAAMWLKTYISPVFFWLHIPGGGLFGVIFGYVIIKAMLEMWWVRNNFAE